MFLLELDVRQRFTGACIKAKVIFTIFCFLLISKAVLADVPDHEHRKPVTIQIKTQHRIMAVIDDHWHVAQKAISSGDLKVSDEALQTILDKAAYMEKFQDYKNADRHDQFISEYRLFVDYIKKLRDKISRQDITAINDDIREVQQSCDRCHGTFR
ncbi:MAG: hypothetical protein ACYC69_00165 [Thermodesulfovibrionales bacterium]